MTVESILKNALNLNTSVIESIEYIEGKEGLPKSLLYVLPFSMPFKILLHVRPYKSEQHKCPICKMKAPVYDYKQDHESWWRAPNLNGIPVVLMYKPCRVACPVHGVHTEYILWADGNSRFTREFNDEVTWMTGKLTKAKIAQYLGVSWQTVGNCISYCLNRLEPDRSVRFMGLRMIAVDETSRCKGHTYITVVYDMERNRVVWVGDGFGDSVFQEFCELLSPEQREQIEVVAGDGAQWISRCTEKYFPNAVRCMDPFHVTQWANEMVDNVRIDSANKAYAEFRSHFEHMSMMNKLYAQSREETEKDLVAAEEEIRNYENKRGRKPKRYNELRAYIEAAREVLKKQDENPIEKEEAETTLYGGETSGSAKTEEKPELQPLSRSQIETKQAEVIREMETIRHKKGRKPARLNELQAYADALQALLDVLEDQKGCIETSKEKITNAEKETEAESTELWTPELMAALTEGITVAENALKTMPVKGRHSARWHRISDAIAVMRQCLREALRRTAEDREMKKRQEDLKKLKSAYATIKGGKYSLGKNPENLTKNQAERLSLIQSGFPEVGIAYGMKEALRTIIHTRDVSFAEKELARWISDAVESPIEPLKRLGSKVERNREYILNSIRLGANSSKSEATNTTIKTLIAMGRGFVNLENLKDLIYLVCSDLVVPLHNRVQPTAEEAAAKRERAAELKRTRGVRKQTA